MRGVITLVFDDGYEAVYQHVLPLLNELHLPAVFALPLDTAAFQFKTTEPVRPWQNWLSIQKAGHEIAAHGTTHTDLRQLTPAVLEQELKQPHYTLQASTLVYPGGALNETVREQTKKHYEAARTTQYGFEKLPPHDPWTLKTVDYTKDNFSLIRANARVLWAWLTNSWLVETYHLVDKKPSNMHHSVHFTDFERHLRFIQKVSIPVKTINETIRDSHN